MIPIYTAQTESEVAVISAMLQAYEVPYFIRGAAFSRLYPGLQIKDYNTQTFMVPVAFLELARELLRDFIQPQPQQQPADTSGAITRIFRVVIEMLLAGWVFTGKRWNKNQAEQDQPAGGKELEK
jgi:CRISPR/Cas system CSM-associated protein Csm5 (group 7 of RAMP superfamily)